MTHYYRGVALVVATSLLATIVTGVVVPGSRTHVSVGLFAAILAVGVHTLFILFMVVTGRVLKEAMFSRQLGGEFLEELNRFFAERRAYPIAVLAATAIVATAVLGYAPRAFGISTWVHVLVGLASVGLNLQAIAVSHRELVKNQALIDRAAATLDDLDREAIARGEDPGEEEPPDPRRFLRFGLILAVSSWMPYLYWVFVEWRGDFGRASVHPWLEGSVLGLAIAALGAWAQRADAEPASE